ncbi:hypothetical protein E2P81_ATG06409 [Venturia nashicola]|nr:hypothetical protein E2P81_ATG06409 [Venturia nashicola]
MCCRGFLLGEFLHDNDFKDAIIDALIDIIKTSSNTYYTSGFNYVYKNTPEDSPLRRLFVDQLVYTRPKNMPARVQALRKTDVTPEALFDIILAMAATKEADSASSSDAPFSKNTCHYHVHGSENPCYKVKYKITGVLRPSLSTTSEDSTTKLDATETTA